jgi:hypothetical protein
MIRSSNCRSQFPARPRHLLRISLPHSKRRIVFLFVLDERDENYRAFPARPIAVSLRAVSQTARTSSLTSRTGRRLSPCRDKGTTNVCKATHQLCLSRILAVPAPVFLVFFNAGSSSVSRGRNFRGVMTGPDITVI